jgi:anti-anti-sigma factor
MLKPHVTAHNESGTLVAEFWDCLRLDPGPVQDLRAKFDAHLRAGGRPVLVIDLLGVGFAGSASLGNFVALHKIARAKNGRLIFCNIDPQVFEVFKVIKLEPLFSFVADRAAALELAKGLDAVATDSAPVALPKAVTGSSAAGPAAGRPGGNGLMHSSRRKKLT